MMMIEPSSCAVVLPNGMCLPTGTPNTVKVSRTPWLLCTSAATV